MRLDFLIEITRRKVMERYIGTSSRLLWVLLAPLIPLIMNLAVFYYIAKIPEVQAMGVATYAAFIFSGLLPFRFIQRATAESCDLLIGNMDMLKSAAFPLTFLSYAAIAALLVDFAIQCVLMAVLLVIAGHSLTWSILLFPFMLVILLMLSLGISWLLSVAGYLLRDIQEIMGVAFGALLYVTPTLYPADAAPGIMQAIIRINPLTHLIIIFRDALIPDDTGPHWESWMIMGGFSLVVLALGYVTIHKARRYVGDMV